MKRGSRSLSLPPKAPGRSASAGDGKDSLRRFGGGDWAQRKGLARKMSQSFPRDRSGHHGADHRFRYSQGAHRMTKAAASTPVPSAETDVMARPSYSSWSEEMMLRFPKEARLNGIYGDWIDNGSPRKKQ